MQDPNDPGTLCLVDACKRPLTGAERQKRRRERLARERAAGKRIPLGDVTLAELQALKGLVGAQVMEGEGERAQLLRSLWSRLVDAELSAYGLKKSRSRK
jgi:hypothetical protein